MTTSSRHDLRPIAQCVVEIDSVQMGSFHRKVVRHRCIRGAAPNTFGNESRTDPCVDAPGLVNIDLSLAKQFRFTEKLRLNVRGELFNSLTEIPRSAGSPRRKTAHAWPRSRYG